MGRAQATAFSPLSSCLTYPVSTCLSVCLSVCMHVHMYVYVQYVCAYVFVYIGEWENSCNELQRMCIVRSLRPDRVPVVVTSYINNNLGHDFTDPPVLNMASVLEDSSCRVPLIFVLSPGVVRGGEGREGRGGEGGEGEVCVCVCDGLGCDSDTGEWRGGVCCGVLVSG